MNTITITAIALAAGCATDLETDSTDDTALADVSIPTADGAASYRFRFYAADGAIATVMDVPIGYAKPAFADDCAADTFARVAPPGTAVPLPLVVACAGHRGPPRQDAGTLPALEVGTAPATPTGPLCTQAPFDARVDELAMLAAYRPLVQEYSLVCDRAVEWDEVGCKFVDQNDHFLDACEDTDYSNLVATYGPSGWMCLHQTLVPDGTHPNTACNHVSWTNPDWGPWSSWARTATVTRLRSEISACGASVTHAHWETRPTGTTTWGTQHGFDIAAHALSIVTLQAGWDSNDHYVHTDFHVAASGTAIHAASAYVDMTGDNRLACPIHI